MVKKVDFNWYEEVIVSSKSDTLEVVNFWATWCKPCVNELPFFEEVRKNNNGQKVRFTYISLDFSSELERVEAFSKERLGGRVVLMSGGGQNEWINKVDSSWSGAIPATVFYKNGKKLDFIEGELDKEGIQTRINQFITK